jgi:TolB-like protein
VTAFYKFGPFRLDARSGTLFRGSEPTELGQRAVALLQALVSQPGVPVSRDALLNAAWAGLAVEESNLTVQIGALRRVLESEAGGQRWIETLSRRGYRYVGPTVTTDDAKERHIAGEATALNLTLPDEPSIAVLPFANLSGDPDQDYFAEGMVEEIITGLSRIKRLFVIARNSSFAYKGRAIDVQQVGRELGVRYVLEGSVRRSGDRVRVASQLVISSTGAHVWAERYDREYHDIFALQDEITLSVVGAIEPTLRAAEIDRSKRKRPENLSAYDLVLQAHADTHSRMPAQSKRALVLLERALALDPAYALAHAYAAECHHSIFLRGGMREEHRLAARRHAEAAIAYGQDDATALTFAGFTIGMEGRDRTTALSLFEQALSFSPSSALTYISGSIILAFGGQAESAIDWAERGLRLSPFDPWRTTALMAIAIGHFHRGRHEDAAAAARKSVQANPAFSIAHVILAAPLAKLGLLEEAKAAAAKVLELQPAFRYGQHFAELAVAPDLAAVLSEALRIAGLSE